MTPSIIMMVDELVLQVFCSKPPCPYFWDSENYKRDDKPLKENVDILSCLR